MSSKRYAVSAPPCGLVNASAGLIGLSQRERLKPYFFWPMKSFVKMIHTENERSKASKKSKIVRKIVAPAQEAVIIDLKPETPQVRYLKTQSFFRVSNLGFFDQSPPQILPELRLKGNWLEAAGFSPNGYVSVTTLKGLLIIRVCER